MKNIIKIGLLASLMLVFGGCNGADYEDKDLTNFFIQNNKEKLNKIYELETQRIKSPFDRADRGELRTFASLSFFEFITFTINERILGCDYPMIINSNSVEFNKKDILSYGKESMYREADKCLNAVLEKIELKKKSDLEKLENEKWETNERELRLNRKFNLNEVK